jgi:hypothetical protein
MELQTCPLLPNEIASDIESKKNRGGEKLRKTWHVLCVPDTTAIGRTKGL